MSRADFESFRRAVLEDPGLQADLREIVESEAFHERCARAARDRGFDVTRDDVAEADREQQRRWLLRWV